MTLTQLPPALQPLADWPQFILWDKATKVPQGSTTDPATWLPYDLAAATAQADPRYGVGFVFTKADPFYFLDIDHAYDATAGAWSPLAQQLVTDLAGAAVEISQSGTGLHIIGANGQAPPHRSRNIPLGIELYTSGRYVALTGTQATGSAACSPPGALERLIAQYFAPDAADAAGADPDAYQAPDPDYTGPADDDELIALMLRSTSGAGLFGDRATLRDLWQGDADALGRAYPHPEQPYDASSADMAIFQHLAFWTGRDAPRMDRLYQRSALCRPKYLERPAYARTTILKACGRCQAVYTGGKRPERPQAQQAAPGSDPGGYRYLSIAQQVERFKGCAYIRDIHRVYLPDGDLVKPEQFKAYFGGYEYALESTGEKTTRNAYEAFTESLGHEFPKAHAACFRPELPPGAIITEAGRELCNTYAPIETPRKQGDPGPFLQHVERLVPDSGDRAILLAYCAACVQYPGIKFQWAPLLQGVEGNGKTLLVRCIAEAIGAPYTHFPNAADLHNKFNYWLLGKLFIGVEEIYLAERQEIIDTLKPLITNDRVDIQGKGLDQKTGDNRANFFFCSNHKNAIRKTQADRRYCVFFTAQQEPGDLERDGMTGAYFPELYAWLRREGYAIVNNYLREYAIPDELNPATSAHRAPTTSSTAEAVTASLGSIEQEVLEAADEGRPGFAGGWVSSIALDKMLDGHGRRRVSHTKRRELLAALGYDLHPGLAGGRAPATILGDGGRPRLYVRRDSPALALQGTDAARAYERAQGWG